MKSSHLQIHQRLATVSYAMPVSYGGIKSCLLRKTYFNSYFQHKSEKKNGDFHGQKALMVKGRLIYTTVGIIGGYQGTLVGDKANP